MPTGTPLALFTEPVTMKIDKYTQVARDIAENADSSSHVAGSATFSRELARSITRKRGQNIAPCDYAQRAVIWSGIPILFRAWRNASARRARGLESDVLH